MPVNSANQSYACIYMYMYTSMSSSPTSLFWNCICISSLICLAVLVYCTLNCTSYLMYKHPYSTVGIEWWKTSSLVGRLHWIVYYTTIRRAYRSTLHKTWPSMYTLSLLGTLTDYNTPSQWTFLESNTHKGNKQTNLQLCHLHLWQWKMGQDLNLKCEYR